MKRIRYSSLAFAALLAVGLIASTLAVAADGRDCQSPVNTPSPTTAVITTRVFNDCPASTVTTFNNYPTMLQIRDTDEGCVGWANLHVWSFSEDGITPAVFENCSHYRFAATICLSGAGAVVEGGLRLSPWWSLDVDGRFMARAGGNGEIACFGGRLPFYSFTGAYGVTYTTGMPITMEIIYNPQQLTEALPATITYNLVYRGLSYTSGPLNFDLGNAAEDPPHGLWGALYPARAGGYFQLPAGNGGALYDFTASWGCIEYEGPSATPANHPTWGQLKSLYK